MAQIEIPQPYEAYIQHLIDSGQFPTPGEVIEAALQEYQQNREREAIAQALEESEASGISDRNIDEIWEEVAERHRNDHSIPL